MQRSPEDQHIVDMIMQFAPKCPAPVQYVPYQVCPICNGTGRLLNIGTSSAIDRSCDHCNGAKVIPMHVIPTHYG